ncbi:MAG: hypothetical protein HY721_18720 [Planctomycetes bacterium]|nr:hypothetical protein [Planctomycetota bacterium]
MPYEISVSDEAMYHLRELSAGERSMILRRVQTVLRDAPCQVSRNLKALRPNPLARYELRVGDFRVFFDPDVDVRVVRVLAVGRKEGSRLYVGGEEIEL